MKRLFFIGLIALMSCSDEEVKFQPVVGEWKWIRTTGGIAGIDERPKDGEVRILEFSSGNGYRYLLNGKETRTGIYALSTGRSYLLNKETDWIRFGNDDSLMYELNKDTLYLAQDVYDGFTVHYVKNK